MLISVNINFRNLLISDLQLRSELIALLALYGLWIDIMTKKVDKNDRTSSFPKNMQIEISGTKDRKIKKKDFF